MHEKGIFITQYGSMYNKDMSCMYDSMAMIISKTEGNVFKYGNPEKCDIIEYYEKMVDRYRFAGLQEMADDLMLISFDRYNGVLNIDDICTLCNWFMNHIGTKLLETLTMDKEQLLKRIKELQEIGW